MIEDDGCETLLEIWLCVLRDKYRAGLQLLPQVCEMRFVIRCQEQKKWWENVIFTMRTIKTNSAVNLSRKLGLDRCCDLLQHLRGVPRTCSFYIIIRTSILLIISTQIVFHMERNQIQLSIYMDGIFCSILFYSVQHLTLCISYPTLYTPSRRVI